MANTVVPIPTLVQGKSSLYNHSDPLIRRLRLEDPYGRPIDSLREVFLGKEVVIFYIGSMHGNGKQAVDAHGETPKPTLSSINPLCVDNLTDLNKVCLKTHAKNTRTLCELKFSACDLLRTSSTWHSLNPRHAPSSTSRSIPLRRPSSWWPRTSPSCA